jgi:hypothetical protein
MKPQEFYCENTTFCPHREIGNIMEQVRRVRNVFDDG